MTDYKNLSKSAFNVQANTYDVDKNGKHARGQYKYVLNELQQLDFQKILDKKHYRKIFFCATLWT